MRLYNELVSDNAAGITYTNFSRYLEEHDDDEVDVDDNDDDYDEANVQNVSFSMDELLDKLGNRKSNNRGSAGKLYLYNCTFLYYKENKSLSCIFT